MKPWLGPGPAAEAQAVTWTRAEKLALALLVGGLLFSLFLLVHPWYDVHNDTALYIITARSIIDGQGYTYLGEPFRLRPPGFPLLIAPLVGALDANFYALHFLVSLFGVLGVVLLFLYQRARLGWVLASLVAVAVWLNPSYQTYCNRVMSDIPGSTLFLLCLLLERRAARSPSWKREVLLGSCIGWSALVRSMNLLLLPAIAASRLVQRLGSGKNGEPWPAFVKDRIALFGISAALVLSPWIVRNEIAPPATAQQTALHDYSTAMWHKGLGNPNSPMITVGELGHRVGWHLRQIATVVADRMQADMRNFARGWQSLQRGRATDARVRPRPVQLMIGVAIGACVMVVLFRRRAPADFFVPAAVVLLASYFTFTPRLILPVYVIVFPAVIEALRDLLRLRLGAKIATALLAAGLVGLTYADFKPHHEWKKIEKRHLAFAEHCAALESILKPDARFGSTLGWHYELLLDRPVPGLQRPMGRVREPEAVEALIDLYDVNTVVISSMDRAGDPPRNPAGIRRLHDYLTSNYDDVVETGWATIIRVRP